MSETAVKQSPRTSPKFNPDKNLKLSKSKSKTLSKDNQDIVEVLPVSEQAA